MKNDLIIKRFETPLGIVVCGLKSDKSRVVLVNQIKLQNGISELYQTVGYQIELIDFKLELPLVNGDSLTDSNGWIWRIKKANDNCENLEMYCRIIDSVDCVDYDIATGEHLDAIEVSNNEWILNIGTEDYDVLNARGIHNDWFPSRFVNEINESNFLAKLEIDGLSTRIPDLMKGERLHVQYLTAYDRKQSDKVNTWIAVDQYIRNLEKWIGIENN